MSKIIMKVKPAQTFLQMHVDNGNTWKKHETHPKPAIKTTKLCQLQFIGGFFTNSK